MTQSWRGWSWTEVVAGFTIPVLLWADCAMAQRRPVADETLGNERSIVTPAQIRSRPSDRITGGAQRGGNLFHSFQEFSIDEGRAAYFDNPAGVENILGRVTGGGRSEIFGRLGVLGNANLFLINPNGIIFGQNASLDVRGSFMGTSANAVQFSNQGFFSASEPNALPLLTVDPSALLFNQLGNGAIENSSRATQLNASRVTRIGLQAANGQSLLLVGGDVLMNQGFITAPGGRVELGGLAGEGSIALVENNGFLRLQFPENVRRSDVSANRSEIAANQGDIAINARNVSLNITDLTIRLNRNSVVFRDRPGNIEINAVESATISGSDISGSTFNDQVNGGDINITARSLTLTSSSSLSSDTFSQRNGGNVNISAEVLSLANDALIRADNGDQGDGGNINITTGTLSVATGSRISTSTSSERRGGTISIDASELVEVAGARGFNNPSTIDAGVGSEGEGGNIRIQTRRLIARDGGQITAGSFGSGNSGDVTILATDSVLVSGRSPANSTRVEDSSDDGSFPSLISAQVQREGTGSGGNIRIETPNLRISGGAAVSARSFGQGRSNGGDITVIAPSSIEIEGVYEYEKNNLPQRRRSGLFTQVGSRTAGDQIEGDAGNIWLETGRLIIRNGGNLNSQNSGPGRAGNIEVTANSVEMSGRSSRFRFESVFTAESIGTGNAGDLIISAEQLVLRDDARIRASTRSGRGGNIRLQGLRTVQVNDGEITAETDTGQAGNLSIDASESITLTNNGSFSVEAAGDAGRSGSLTINTRELLLQDGARITASTTSGQSGGIALQGLERLDIQNGQISASTQTGLAGSLTIRADTVRLDGKAGGLSVAATNGQAGGLNINTDRLAIQNGARVTVSSTETGRAGNLVITADNVMLDDQSQLTAETEFGSGGNIQLRIFNSLRLSDRSVISASTQGGQGGSLTLNANRVATDTVQLNNSQLLVQANGNGIAGSINLNTGQLMLHNRAVISATTVSSQQGGNITLQGLERLQVTDSAISASTQTGRAGSLTVNASGLVHLSGHSANSPAGLSVQATGDRGRAGSLIIRADELSISNGATISASTTSGRGGNIRLEELAHLRLNEGQISASTQSGRGGDLTVNARQLTIQSSGSEIVATSGSGVGGNIEINAEQVSVRNRAGISASTNSGQAGSLRVNATDSIELNNRGSLAVRAQSSNATAGDLSVTTDRFTAAIGASATVSSPEGQAGNLTITANSVQLDRSKLTAETQGRGGESGATIRLQSLDSLVLQNRSLISAQARGNARGGNVAIDSNFIVAPIGQDNDIVASAARGQGGDIQITTQGLFGLEEQNVGNSTNDIDASSQFGVQGTVAINRPDVDPSRGLAELPIAPVDASNQIAQTCPTRGSRTVASALDEFVVTGRGGLPTSPIEPLNSEDPLADWAALDSEQPNNAIDVSAQSTASPSENSVVEATAWRVDAAGKIALIAEAPTDLQMPGSNSAKCQ